MFRIGFGTDVHRLTGGRKLMIGGITVESDLGAEGHSDADVLMHAVTDALLGALALGDIGTHFPNTDDRWRGAGSSQFVRHALGLVLERGYEPVNVDSTIDLETPRLRPHIDLIRQRVAEALQLPVDSVSVKAKTGEKVDSVGDSKAIRAQAVILLMRKTAGGDL